MGKSSCWKAGQNFLGKLTAGADWDLNRVGGNYDNNRDVLGRSCGNES